MPNNPSSKSPAKEPSTTASCLGCLVLVVIASFIAFAVSSCSNTKEDPVSLPAVSTLKEKTPEQVPSLTEYNVRLKPLFAASYQEYQILLKERKASPDLKQQHFEIDSLIESARIKNRFYTNHAHLDGYLAGGHASLISLWQSYEDNNEKQINDFTNMAADYFAKFQTLSQQIDAGQVTDEYHGPTK